ncbi:unnamed protein product [Prunus armeniaca]
MSTNSSRHALRNGTSGIPKFLPGKKMTKIPLSHGFLRLNYCICEEERIYDVDGWLATWKVSGFMSMERMRSRVSLLKVYIVASSIGILLSIACVAIGNLTLEVFQNPSNWETKKFELLEATHTAIGEYLCFLDVMLLQPKLGKE